ncbi:hypothetical protein [Streptomyces sp. NPDC059909]
MLEGYSGPRPRHSCALTGTPSFAAMQTDDGDPGGKVTFETYGDIVT